MVAFRDLYTSESLSPFKKFLDVCALNYQHSKSQIFQDLFVIHCLRGKRDGYFVEFGATNGINLSNTYALENSFGWTGILAEPARNWHADLKKNRTAHIETRCVWSKSGEMLDFCEAQFGELSTLASFTEHDSYGESRKGSTNYQVETISLNDMLDLHNAPEQIDFMSVDTEGSEFTILNEFDFKKHRPLIMTIEHNYTPSREKMRALMARNTYVNVFPEISLYDDWYIDPSLLERLY